MKTWKFIVAPTMFPTEMTLNYEAAMKPVNTKIQILKKANTKIQILRNANTKIQMLKMLVQKLTQNN